jgi:iron complex transport system substrate-binding protein
MTRILLLIFLYLASYCSGLDALRIVSLAPYLTEELVVLNSQDQLVGITTVGKKLLNLKGIETVGDTLNVNIEKILTLKPDLILATPMNKPTTIQKLKELGFKVKMFGMGKDFKDCCQIFRQIGILVGKEEMAKRIINKVKVELLEIEEKLKVFSKPTVFLVIDYKPLITAGGDCYLDEIIKYAGGGNIADRWGRGFFRINLETIIKADPDFIISIAEEGSEDVLSQFSNLTAVKENRIYHLDPDPFSRPNPVNFLNAVKLLIEVLHPEFKNEN